jgi:DNA-binding NtrC family response regulator
MELLPVLVIEDEESILTFLEMTLHKGGLKTVGAASGSEALALLEKGKFSGVISDLRLPGEIDGAKIFEWVRQKRPELAQRFLFVSGDINADYAAEIRRCTGALFLEKPFHMAQLMQMVRRMISWSNPAHA